MSETTTPPSSRAVICMADANDRELIYAARHEVYASELRQHPMNSADTLQDPLDEFNEYIVVKQDARLLGFISITPPERHYSIDKYFRREQLPLTFDSKLYEIRLLTVHSEHRGRLTAVLLMYAAFRFVESHGGSELVAIGRRQLLPMYERCGMQKIGLSTKSGAVHYELLSASTERVRETISRETAYLERMERVAEWRLPFEFRSKLHCEHGGAFWQVLGDEFRDLNAANSIVSADVLDAWFDAAPEVLSAIQQHLPLLLKTSPPTHGEGLVRAIARARQLPERCVLPAAGSSALIFLAFQNWLKPSSRVLLIEPAYGEYRHVLENVIGCSVRSFLTTAETNFRPDISKLREAVRDCDMAIIVNPNSPTGCLLSRAELEEVVRGTQARFWIDETYIDYAGSNNSMESSAADSPNVFVCKSMSKAYALSGARVAYMVGPQLEIERLSEHLPPWAVSLPAQVAAIAALESDQYYRARYQETATLREELASSLAERCGIRAFPGAANFLLCVLPPGANADSLVQALREHSIFMRTGESIHASLGPNTVRIAVKSRDANIRILNALTRALARATHATSAEQ